MEPVELFSSRWEILRERYRNGTDRAALIITGYNFQFDRFRLQRKIPAESQSVLPNRAVGILVQLHFHSGRFARDFIAFRIKLRQNHLNRTHRVAVIVPKSDVALFHVKRQAQCSCAVCGYGPGMHGHSKSSSVQGTCQRLPDDRGSLRHSVIIQRFRVIPIAVSYRYVGTIYLELDIVEFFLAVVLRG